MRQLTHKRLTAWLLTLVMALSLLPAAALADEVDEDLSPPALQEDYGYVRLVFSEGEQLDLHRCTMALTRTLSPTASTRHSITRAGCITRPRWTVCASTRTRFSPRRTSRSYRWASLPRKRPLWARSRWL